MDLTTVVMQFVLGGAAAAAGAGPSAPPIEGNPAFSGYGGGDVQRLRLHWENGDPTAYTEIYYSAVAPANKLGTALPGIASFETEYWDDQDHTFRIRHMKNAQYSADIPLQFEGW